MKKRLTSLLLCLVMLLSVFLASCAEETDEDVQNAIEEMAAKNTVSLTMWVVAEEKVDPAVASEVAKALSTMTEASYKARLNINFLTRDEYYEKIKENIEAYDEYLTVNKIELDAPVEYETDENGETILPEQTEGEVETDATGMLRDKYPDLLPNQVDIIYIGDVKGMSGEAMFNELVASGSLAKLDESLNTSAKKLHEYLSPTLLSAVQKNGVTYAIPNNNVIGEYTYMLLNKQLSDIIFSGYILNGELDNLYNGYAFSFLDQIKSTTGDSVLPIDATYEECLELLAHYWTINPDTYTVDGADFSIFGTLYEDLSKLSRGDVSFDVESLFANPDFVESYLKLNSYRLNDEGRDFFRSEKNKDKQYEQTAIKFIKGDLTILTEVVDANTGESVLYYDDTDGTRYYAVPVKYPSATTEDIYSNMFAVCSDSVDPARCMDVITMINTDTEARNLLQYGVLDTHYELKERRVEGLDENERSFYAEPKTDKQGKQLYHMDLYATGNAFLCYLPFDMNENIWASGKIQNRSSLVYPLLGFELSAYASSIGKIGNDISLPNVTGATEEKVSYTLSYSSGYDKSVLAQNKTVADWIAACDKAEKGVFVFRTFESNNTNQKMDSVIYVYNTMGQGEFSVIPTPTKEPVVNKDGTIKEQNGKPVYNEVAMDLGMTYTNMKDTGYTLSVINYTGSYSASYKNTVSASVNGTAVDAAKVVEKQQELIVEFDEQNSKYYNVEVFGDLYASHFAENAYTAEILEDWIDGKGGVKVLSWVDKTGAKDEYTFLVFRGNLDAATDLDVQIRGSEKAPVINLVYTSLGLDDDGKPLAEMGDLLVDGESAGVYKREPYLLYYITATLAKDAKVTLNATSDVLEDGKAAEALTIETTVAEDASSKMDVYGELDTELVAYMEALSSEVEAVLDACTTYDELAAVVADLGVLLSNKSEPKEKDIKTDKVKALIDGDLIDGELDELYEKVRHITSSKTLADLEESEDGSKPESGEERYYYLSPYGIYYEWMKDLDYLPA